ncbi:SgcJ/EcaC family oxidoreductase [Pusillimonas sp.]|uniref:YybH family protein n=1 Tax=Pusillimonas sp. TaxID=3040095 RepID=UPI0029B2A915|nr:SgcJ/EcaC family oxidoreductase [Pusillimonas sp.]MDX3894196.1 SgcJ/EcaC family oxidoreductase [Pusillimonas sp.]
MNSDNGHHAKKPENSSTPDQGSDTLHALLGLWQAAFDNHDADALAGLFATDVLFQGLAPTLLSGREAVRDYYRRVPEGTSALIEDIEAISLTPDIISGHAKVTFVEADRRLRPACLSITAQKLTGQWLIQSYHASALPGSCEA